MNVIWYLSDTNACGLIRGDIPARAINRLRNGCSVVCKTECVPSDMDWADVMVFQRSESTAMYQNMMTAKEYGIGVIYDIDDDNFNMPAEFPQPSAYYHSPQVVRLLTNFMCSADAVTVSTPALVASLAKNVDAANFKVVCNAIDSDLWTKAFWNHETREDDAVVIGWMASASHYIDAPLVGPVLVDLMEEYPNLRLKMIGWVGWGTIRGQLNDYHDRISTVPWIPLADLPSQMADFDISICPLTDNPYNRAKSSIKWMQSSLVGAATVASNLPAYEDITPWVTGVLVDGDQYDAWHNPLAQMIEDRLLRTTIAAAARQDVLQNHDVTLRVKDWMQVYNEVHSCA